MGALAAPIADQLRAAGYEFDARRIVLAQEDANAVTMLFVRGVLSKADASHGWDRIARRVAKHVTPRTSIVSNEPRS
jgi:hypothetical protein